MGNSETKHMHKHVKAEKGFSRPFGTNPQAPQPEGEELKSTLYMKLGTKVATITAHYEHIPNNSESNVTLKEGKAVTAFDNRVYMNVEPGASSKNAKPNVRNEAKVLEINEPVYEELH